MTSHLEDFWRVEFQDHGIVWCTRAARPYLSVTMLDEVLVLLDRRLERVNRPERSLLLDLRVSPIVNQGEWTSGALLHHRRRLVRGFRRAGFLVQSSDQADPIPRAAGPDSPEVQLFRDPDRARGAMRLPHMTTRQALG